MISAWPLCHDSLKELRHLGGEEILIRRPPGVRQEPSRPSRAAEIFINSETEPSILPQKGPHLLALHSRKQLTSGRIA